MPYTNKGPRNPNPFEEDLGAILSAHETLRGVGLRVFWGSGASEFFGASEV